MNSHGMNDMNKEVNTDPKVKAGIYHAPWEKSFDRILTPFEEFIHRQTTSGLLLMALAVVALVLANGPLASAYEHVIHTLVSFNIGDWTLEMTLHHWINDGLMALFFFVVGLELKREMLVGELANPRNAVMPIAAAVGGMVVPALIYSPSIQPVTPRSVGVFPWPPILRLPSVRWPCWRAGCPRH